MLTGKVCVVNGAASEIGRAVSERFTADGAVVVGVDRVEHSVGDLPLVCDLTQESQVEAMYRTVVAEHGRLDVIYNNMGLGRVPRIQLPAARSQPGDLPRCRRRQ